MLNLNRAEEVKLPDRIVANYVNEKYYAISLDSNLRILGADKPTLITKEEYEEYKRNGALVLVDIDSTTIADYYFNNIRENDILPMRAAYGLKYKTVDLLEGKNKNINGGRARDLNRFKEIITDTANVLVEEPWVLGEIRKITDLIRYIEQFTESNEMESNKLQIVGSLRKHEDNIVRTHINISTWGLAYLSEQNTVVDKTVRWGTGGDNRVTEAWHSIIEDTCKTLKWVSAFSIESSDLSDSTAVSVITKCPEIDYNSAMELRQLEYSVEFIDGREEEEW